MAAAGVEIRQTHTLVSHFSTLQLRPHCVCVCVSDVVCVSVFVFSSSVSVSLALFSSLSGVKRRSSSLNRLPSNAPQPTKEAHNKQPQVEQTGADTLLSSLPLSLIFSFFHPPLSHPPLSHPPLSCLPLSDPLE